MIFNPTDVICEVDKLKVLDDGEATGGSEPYLWSIFFKVDGDGVSATIDINDDGVDLSLDGDPFVDSPDEGSHGNLELKDGTVRAGGLFEPGGLFGSKEIVTVDIPSAVGRFKTTLKPIPTTVKIDPDSWVAGTIRDVVLNVENITDLLSGVDQCPSLADDSSQLVGEFSSEFITELAGGIPGAFGAVYILMEEDGTSETAAERGRRALRNQFETELVDTVMPAISFTNQAPSDTTMEDIESRLEQAVTDAIIAGTQWWEWLTLLPALDPDDPLGSAQAMMSHVAITAGQEQPIDEAFSAPNGNGKWRLLGRIGRDS
jgi:hypothetical protein